MIPTFDAEELRALQLERLRDTLTRVHEHVPHYRHAFEHAGVHPSDVTSLADLARLPFTTKEDLRQNYPFGMFAVPREQVNRVHASSGTTGRPTVVGYTAEDIATWAEVMARSIYAAGGRPGDGPDDGARGHGQRSRDRARWLHLHAGRLGLRVRLQLLQPQHGRGRLRDPLPRADPAGRRAGGRGRGAQP